MGWSSSARLDEALLGCPQQLILVRSAAELRQMGELGLGFARRCGQSQRSQRRTPASDGE
jgi:hypothetical protein